jgi:hypothetical protein
VAGTTPATVPLKDVVCICGNFNLSLIGHHIMLAKTTGTKNM